MTNLPAYLPSTATTAHRWQQWALEARLRLWEACGYVPHAGQIDIHASDARYKVAACGTRWGKSFMGAAEILPVLMTPGTQTWIVAPAYNVAIWVWQHLMNYLTVSGIHPSCTRRFSDATTSHAGFIELCNGSWVQSRSAGQPGNLLGAELDLIVADEAAKIPETVWYRYLRGRLTSRQGRLFVPSTPSGATGWVREMWDRGQDRTPRTWAESVHSWQEPTWRNPYIPVEEIIAARKEMPELLYQEQFEAAFTQLAGRIYPEWRYDTHVVEKLPEGWQHWPRWRAVDFGWTNPSAVVWLALEPGGAWHVLSEIYGTQLQYEELACLIREHPLSKPASRIVGTLGDSEDPQGHAALRRFGVNVNNEVTRVQGASLLPGGTGKVKLDKAVYNGMMTVKSRLKNNRLKFVSPDALMGDPQFALQWAEYVNNQSVVEAMQSKFRDPPAIGPGCEHILFEIENYVWDSQDDHPIDRPAPHQADHLCFPRGQMVDMADGAQVPIEWVDEGDEVATADGVATVEAAGFTGVSSLVKLTLSDTRCILCTDDHPLLLADGTWIEASESEGKEICVLNGLSGEEEHTAGIQNQSDGLTGATSRGQEAPQGTCTSRSGYRCTGRSQTAIASTTSTETPGTTTCTTSRASRSRSTPTTTDHGRTTTIWRTLKRSAHLLRSGIVAMRAGLGIACTLLTSTRSGSLKRATATTVEQSTEPSTEEETGSVATSARQHGDSSQESTTKSGLAPYAERRLRLTDTLEKRLAAGHVGLRRVGRVEGAGTDAVFSLATTSGTFSVHGVVVSNCDAVRYVLHTVDPLDGAPAQMAGGGGVFGDTSKAVGEGGNGKYSKVRRIHRPVKPGAWAKRYK